jgi:dGTPase
VFALDPDDTVRTRLTHSLEVAHIGVYIVDVVFALIDRLNERAGSPDVAQWKALNATQRLAIRTFVEVACLVHDIGNPPFGHFGEKAIRRWFKTYFASAPPTLGEDTKSLLQDFEMFDGNKQGFRILTRLQRNMGDRFGLNLTYTQLACTLKYPTPREGRSKGSVFESERDLQRSIWSELGLSDTARHPLVLLMEAADDIAYCLSDIEDADDKGLLSTEDLDEALGPSEAKNGDKSRRFTRARTDITRTLVAEAARRFVGRLKSAKDAPIATQTLLDDTRGVLGGLKSLATKAIYSCPLVLANEVTAFQIITGLLNAFRPLLGMDSADFRALADRFSRRESIYKGPTKKIADDLTSEPGMLALFPKKHLAAYLEIAGRSSMEHFYRAHLLVDFIAGMTDEFALSTYRLVSGQRTYAANR